MHVGFSSKANLNSKKPTTDYKTPGWLVWAVQILTVMLSLCFVRQLRSTKYIINQDGFIPPTSPESSKGIAHPTLENCCMQYNAMNPFERAVPLRMSHRKNRIGVNLNHKRPQTEHRIFRLHAVNNNVWKHVPDSWLMECPS